jgi:hypothetical protein
MWRVSLKAETKLIYYHKRRNEHRRKYCIRIDECSVVDLDSLDMDPDTNPRFCWPKIAEEKKYI